MVLSWSLSFWPVETNATITFNSLINLHNEVLSVSKDIPSYFYQFEALPGQALNQATTAGDTAVFVVVVVVVVGFFVGVFPRKPVWP